MLQNEPLVANIGVETAENEPIFGWIQAVQFPIFNSSILSLGGTREQATAKSLARACRSESANPFLIFRNFFPTTARTQFPPIREEAESKAGRLR